MAETCTIRAPAALAALAIAPAPAPCTASKRLGAALGQDADQIDGDVGIAHRGLDRGRVAQIGLHGVDLADLAERLQMPGQFRPPHRDPDPVIALGQRPDHAAAQKAGSSENRDERVQIRCHGVHFLGVKVERSQGIKPFRDTPTGRRCTAHLAGIEAI